MFLHLLSAQSVRQLVLGGRDADGLGGVVEDGVVLAHEDVAEDPQRAAGGGHVEARQAEEAQGAVGDQVQQKVFNENWPNVNFDYFWPRSLFI